MKKPKFSFENFLMSLIITAFVGGLVICSNIYISEYLGILIWILSVITMTVISYKIGINKYKWAYKVDWAFVLCRFILWIIAFPLNVYQVLQIQDIENNGGKK
jgi:hypothetical protein